MPDSVPPAAMPHLSVIVPCHNEAEALPVLLGRLVPVADAATGGDFELILVDDGSTDGTTELMAQAQADDPRIVAVILSRNFGHQLALSAGLTFSRGARVLLIDADLQDPPELLPEMMERMNQGADVVYGKRLRRDGETVFKTFSSRLFYRLISQIAEIDMARDAGDFRLISRRVADILVEMPEQHRYIRGMVSWAGFRQDAVEYERAARVAGETKYPLAKMIRFAADAVTGFTVLPLKLATWLGFAIAGISLVIFLYVLASWLTGASVQGWPSLMATVLMMGAVQLIVIGILGEYLGRLYMQAKGRPLFVVDRVLRGPPDGGEPAEGADG